MNFDNRIVLHKTGYDTLNNVIEDIVGMLQDNIDDIESSIEDGVYEYEKEIERLEDRITYLEDLLDENGIIYNEE